MVLAVWVGFHSAVDAISLICKTIDLVASQLKSSKVILGHSGSGMAATEIARRLLDADLMEPTFNILNYHRGYNLKMWLLSMELDINSTRLEQDLQKLGVLSSLVDDLGFKPITGNTIILQGQPTPFISIINYFRC